MSQKKLIAKIVNSPQNEDKKKLTDSKKSFFDHEQKPKQLKENYPNYYSFLGMVKRRWLTVSTVAIAVTTSAIWWTLQQSPIYQGKFLLLVDKNSSEEMAENQEKDESIDNITDSGNVDYSTEVQILKSATVLSPILQQISASYPDIYDDIDFYNLDNLDVRQVDKSKIIEVIFRDENPDKIKYVLDSIANSYIQNNINQFQNGIGNGLSFVNSKIPILEKEVNSLQGNIESLRKQYKFIDPQIQATELTQQLVATEKEYFEAKVQLEQANSVYNNLQEQLKMTPEDAIALTYLTESPKYQELLKQLREIEIELANQSAIFTDESPQIITLKEKQENINNLIKEEIKKYPLQYPELVEKNNNFLLSIANPSEMRAKLSEELVKNKGEIKALKSKINGLEKVLNDLNKRLKELPTATKKYNDLQRNLAVSTGSLKRFLETREKLEIETAQQTVNWQIISPPEVEKEPVYSITIYGWIFGLLGGLTLGIIVGFIIDKLDGSIYTIKELKQVSKLPVLGQIPHHKKLDLFGGTISLLFSSFASDKTNDLILKSDSYLQGGFDSYWWDSFSHLYSNIDLLSFDSECYSLVISSANPQEGKSVISLNLAIMAASRGKRVLLIDGDLKLSQLHQLLAIENSYGLRNILAQEITINSAIQKLDNYQNLSVITSGSNHQENNYIFNSKNIKNLLKSLKDSQNFDLIIFDSPSLFAFSDAKLMASSTDGLILTVTMAITKGDALHQILEQLSITNVSVVGAIANKVKLNDQDIYHQSKTQKYYQNQNIPSNPI